MAPTGMMTSGITGHNRQGQGTVKWQNNEILPAYSSSLHQHKDNFFTG